MSELNCGECRACCEWKGEVGLRPSLTIDEAFLLEHEFITEVQGVNPVQVAVLKANEKGDCFYLGDEGCTNYVNRPIACRVFDCRELYQDMKGKCFVKVLVKGRGLSDE